MNDELSCTINSKLMAQIHRVDDAIYSADERLNVAAQQIGGKVMYHEGKPYFVTKTELERVDNVIHKTLTSSSEVTINGDKLPIPEITWDGTPNQSVVTAYELCLACECCPRHEDPEGKPTSLCGGWKEMPSRKHLRPDVGEPGCEYDCSCSCRHRARMMARQFAN